MVFLGSMSDIFHPAVPFEDIKKVWDIGVKCPQHTLQILTKRIERALEFTQWMAGRDDISIAEWPRNFWLGTSISTQADLEKVWQTMRDIPAAVKFYSYEPALEGIKFDLPYLGYIVSALEFIDQVIIGCESGPKQRPCEIEWIRDAVRQCKEAGVATFLKQMPINGKCNKHPKDWPKWARIQEYPK